MRTFTSALILTTLSGLSVLAFGGCTTVLGDFEVSNDAPGAGGNDGGSNTNEAGEPCTTCNGVCVDTQTSTLNCGACGIACLGGQTCTAGKCGCPETQAFCGGQCVNADRQHCGASCAQCQGDEICVGSCKVAPPASFDETPLDTTGWVDQANRPLSFKIHHVGPGTTYECRTGPAKNFTATVPAWQPCDVAVPYGPTPDAVLPEGTYRTELRYRNDTFRSEPAAYEYYVHHSLDRVATCPRSGQPDGPHFKDAEYFAAATAFQVANPGAFDISTPFPQPGTAAGDPMRVQPPFIKIPFTQAQVLPHMRSGSTWAAAGTTLIDYTVTERNLRHQFTLNPTRTMVMVKRRYVNPRKGGCENNFQIGTNYAAKTAPPGLTRGARYFDCEALVLNTQGKGLCMGPNAGGTAPEPRLIDTSIDHYSANYTGYSINAAAANATQITLTGANTTGWGAYYLQIPNRTGPWYKVSGVVNANTVSINPPLRAAIPAGTQFRYASTLVQRYVIPTGFAKLIQQPHKLLPPSLGTKCETLGCSDGKPWLTYLPP